MPRPRLVLSLLALAGLLAGLLPASLTAQPPSAELSRRVVRIAYGTVFSGNPQFVDLPAAEREEYLDSRVLQQALEAHASFPGQNTPAALGTAWGMVNGITAFLDHVKTARTVDARLNNSWFGAGRNLKKAAMDYALDLVA